mgnify:CR=1 FL=1
MAAELLRAQDLEQESVIDARGLIVLFPEPVHAKKEAIMHSAQMSLEKHFSLQLKKTDLQEDTLILTIEESHKKKILSEYQTIAEVYTLSEFTGVSMEIPNPYGQPLTAYGECYEMISELINKLTKKLNSYTKGGE